MELSRVIKEKRAAESKILCIIKDFSAMTGLKVNSVDIGSIKCVDISGETLTVTYGNIKLDVRI
jgi:hypothetical protein